MAGDFDSIEDEHPAGKTYDLRLLVRLARYFKPYRRTLAFSLVLLLVITGVELLLPYLTKVAIDSYILRSARKLTLPADDPLSRSIQEQYRSFLHPANTPGTFFITDPDLDHLDQQLLHRMRHRGWVEETRYYPLVTAAPEVQALLKDKPELIEPGTESAFLRYDHLGRLPREQLLSLRRQDLAGVMWIGLAFLALLLVDFVCSYGQIYYMEYTGQKVMHDLRIRLCGHLQGLTLQFFEHNPVGRLVTRTTSDIQNLQEMFSSIFVQFLKDLVLLLGIMGIMLVMHWKLALICFCLLPLIAALTVFFGVKARDAFRDVRRLIARINISLQENFSGIAVVKIFNRQRENARRFEMINHDHYLANVRQIVIFAIFTPAIEIFSAVTIALLMWRGGEQVLAQSLSLGVLVAFLSYIQKMFQPIRFLAERYNIMQSALASAERIFSLLDIEDRIPDPSRPAPLAAVRGAIEFRNVCFGYDPAQPVLRDISFHVNQGETVAVVGATGAGKSTLIKLLLRFYDPQAGTILLDSVDIASLRKDTLRSRIGLVLQDPFLFAETISYNIRLGNTAISEDALRQVARVVNADRFIARLSAGFEEKISEEGSTLSTGERQLLSFARALAFDPAILVLDEATAHIDPETERLIQEALVRLTERRTSLIIAHRLSTIRRAHRILVLHKGSIREEGTHEQLMARRGIYYRLYQLQYASPSASAP
jgi:ATP-binding cassette, subfamily B, multidrug efflux pump